jgi:hypothetical protein
MDFATFRRLCRPPHEADIPVFPFCAYSLPGAVHGLTGLYLGQNSLLEDFAFAKPAS